MTSSWSPKRTIQEADEILCAPGSMHEIQTALVGGQIHRIYKNIWPSLRDFWLVTAQQHKDAIYVVFENQRYTFGQIFERSLKAAAIFRDVYRVSKGDRIAICSRNYPDYLVAFWASQLIGAVSTLVNAWASLDTLLYCLVHTESKLIIVDAERADRLEPTVKKLVADAGTTGILVLESHEGKGTWEGMTTWDDALKNFKNDGKYILELDLGLTPEDDATIFFTSGTTGKPKGVLSTQRQFITNVPNSLVRSRRAILRRGEVLTQPESTGPQKGVLISVPLFHVTGMTGLAMLATLGGFRIVFMRRWNAEDAVRLIKNENIRMVGGVPSTASDLVDSSGRGLPLDTVTYGGAPAPDNLPLRIGRAFPTAVASQGYGMTETNGTATGVAGEDYLAHPASCGPVMPVNDILIMNGDKCVRVGTVGEVWLRGPNIMKCYWRDPEATDKVLTKDGWLKTGDLGLLDEAGFLYIRDRIKDIIIRGGENIDSVSIENSLYADDRVSEVAAVGIPDPRLGELVAAVVSIKPMYYGQVTEESLISLARKSLPRIAVPVMIVVKNEPLERTPTGKIIKGGLRQLALKEWMKRSTQIANEVKL
ncbi:acetyl-CoA synthetase-like protein [Phlegmacium glaucopus]|nr:acetyl-CoA synthetase-like protein [Phlegmacium glaucopus]